MEIGQGKIFEKAKGGAYVGTIIDVIDLPNQTINVQGQVKTVNKIIIKWVLAHLNGAPYLDKDGQPMTVAAFPTAILSAKSKLTKLLTQILNSAPPVINSTEQLAQLLLGRANSLFLTQEPDNRTPGAFFTNVAGVSPMPEGVPAPKFPGYVRQKDKAQQTSGPQPGQTTATYAAPPAGAGQPVNLSRPASNDAF